MVEKEKKKKKFNIEGFFDNCKNPIQSANIALPYAKRRLEMNDDNPFSMYQDWLYGGNGDDFQEAIAALEFFKSISKFPDILGIENNVET